MVGKDIVSPYCHKGQEKQGATVLDFLTPNRLGESSTRGHGGGKLPPTSLWEPSPGWFLGSPSPSLWSRLLLQGGLIAISTGTPSLSQHIFTVHIICQAWGRCWGHKSHMADVSTELTCWCAGDARPKPTNHSTRFPRAVRV